MDCVKPTEIAQNMLAAGTAKADRSAQDPAGPNRA